MPIWNSARFIGLSSVRYNSSPISALVNILVIDENLIFWYTRLSSYVLHTCIVVSALILHIPRTLSYNGIYASMTQQNMSYYYWLLVTGGSSGSDFCFSRSHRPRSALIIILNGVFLYQQLYIIVVNVMLHGQLDFLFVFDFSECSHVHSQADFVGMCILRLSFQCSELDQSQRERISDGCRACLKPCGVLGSRHRIMQRINGGTYSFMFRHCESSRPFASVFCIIYADK